MEERARIARELHDIVAHNVSLMVVQTIAADRVQDRDSAKAHELHGTVEETGRATVTELRRLLDVLRTDEEAESDPNKEPPQPTVDALPGACGVGARRRSPGRVRHQGNARRAPGGFDNSPSTASCRKPSPTPSSTPVTRTPR